MLLAAAHHLSKTRETKEWQVLKGIRSELKVKNLLLVQVFLVNKGERQTPRVQMSCVVRGE